MMKSTTLSVVHDVRNTRTKEKAGLGRKLSQAAARNTLVNERREKKEKTEGRRRRGKDKERAKTGKNPMLGIQKAHV